MKFTTAALIAILTLGLMATGGASQALAGSAPPAKAVAAPARTVGADVERAGHGVLEAGATAYAARIDNAGRASTLTLGVADRATGQKARARHEFQIGSNTKTMVATVALQLVGEGELTLDDTVEYWLPGVVPNGANITVRMLLQHTSGLFDYAADPAVGEAILFDAQRVWTREELVAVAVAHGPGFAPGASWSYSNTGYVLAGMILERATHRDVATLIRERIAEPLGMRHTYWATSAGFDSRHLSGYYRTQPGGTEYIDVSDNSLSWADAAGAVISNLDDLTRFAQALQGGELLQPAQLKQMRTTVDIPGQAGSAAYGLGVARLSTPAGPVWGHTGGTIGYNTQVWATADGSRSVVQVVPTGSSTPAGPDTAIENAASSAIDAALTEMVR